MIKSVTDLLYGNAPTISSEIKHLCFTGLQLDSGFTHSLCLSLSVPYPLPLDSFGDGQQISESEPFGSDPLTYIYCFLIGTDELMVTTW